MRRKSNSPDCLSEESEQTAVARYLEELKQEGKVLLYSALPNNTFTRSWNQRRKQRAEGVRKGVPDLLIVFPHKVLFLEMKREKASYPRPEQREWLKALEGKTIEATWAAGAEKAKTVIDQIVGNHEL